MISKSFILKNAVLTSSQENKILNGLTKIKYSMNNVIKKNKSENLKNFDISDYKIKLNKIEKIVSSITNVKNKK